MKKGIKYLSVAGSLALAVSLFNCKDDVTGDGGSPSNVVFPTDSVSYIRHVQPLFNQTCALSGCHDDGQNQSALKLTNWANTMNSAGAGIVIAGDPQNSLLIIRVEGRVGARMPLNRNPLNQNQITGLRTWIAEGAGPQ